MRRKAVSVGIVSLVATGLMMGALVATPGKVRATCGGSGEFTNCWFNYNKSTESTTATQVQADIRITTAAPKSTDTYYVYLRAEDNTGSLNDLGLKVSGGTLTTWWAYTSCSANYGNDGPNPTGGYSPGGLYTFRMTISGGKVAYDVLSGGSPVISTQYSTPQNGAPSSFLIEGTGGPCSSAAIAYANVLRDAIDSNVPDASWEIQNNQNNAGGTLHTETGWQALYSSTSPTSAYITRNDADVMFENWHDYTQYTSVSFGLQKGSSGMGLQPNAWHVGLYHGHTYIYFTKGQYSTSWQTPIFAGGDGGNPAWLSYSNTNPTMAYSSDAGKWMMAWTDGNNNVNTIRSYDSDPYAKQQGQNCNYPTLCASGFDASTQITLSIKSTASVGLTYTSGNGGVFYLAVIDQTTNKINLYSQTYNSNTWNFISLVKSPDGTVTETGQKGVSLTPCCSYIWLAFESTETPGQIIVYEYSVDMKTANQRWLTGEHTNDRPEIHSAGPYVYLVWPGVDGANSINTERFSFVNGGRWEFKVTLSVSSDYSANQVGEALYGPNDYCSSNCLAWTLVWQDKNTNGNFDSMMTRIGYS